MKNLCNKGNKFYKSTILMKYISLNFIVAHAKLFFKYDP